MLKFKFENTQKCDVEGFVNGFEAFESVMVKFNSDPQ